MKILRLTLVGLLLLLMSQTLCAQAGQVGINTNDPDESAVLDIVSEEGGLLIPRLTTIQRDAISLAEQPDALLIFNTTERCFQAYNVVETQWENIYCFVSCNPTITTHPVDQSICETENTSFTVTATGQSLTYQWQVDDGGGWDDITAAGSNPTYANWTTETLSVNSVVASNDGYSYRCIVSGSCSPDGISNDATLTVNITPVSPTAGTHIAGEDQIEWNWNVVSGATGYKYNTVNDYLTATDNGSSTSYLQSALTCETSYSLYVWAYSSCGESSSFELIENTSDCPCTGCGGNTDVVEVSNPATGEIWMDRNLGACQQATSATDYNAYGSMYQWGRSNDGHECINWISSSQTDGTEQTHETSTLSNSDNPGHGDFITNGSDPYDWRSPQNDNLWQGVAGTNNPCPSGYRLPTEAEWEAERTTWSSSGITGAFGSPLKLTSAGYRHGPNGELYSEGTGGYYHSSTVVGTEARMLYYYSGTDNIVNKRRSHGCSVRCIKD